LQTDLTIFGGLSSVKGPKHETDCSELSSGMYCRVKSSWIVMEAVSTSETSVDNHFTRQYIPEDNSEHHTRRRENLKSHMRQILLTGLWVPLLQKDCYYEYNHLLVDSKYKFPIVCA
jgi:hypothetical protein